jgi:predicted enzyme related to lactoylglutathione lyase
VIKNAIASLAVIDVSKAAEWYERLFGRPADATPMKDLLEWKFEDGGWLQVYQAPDRAGQGSCTLFVTDLVGEVSRLQQAGLATSEPTQAATVKVMMIKDPDGNSIALAETAGR